MMHFTKLIRWISSQEHLYFLLALLFVVPNFVLFITEPLPVTIGIASILLPLAFWMGVLLLTRKPGIVALCLLPKIILDGGQLVLLYLFGESVIAVDMFLNLTSSDASEASELLGNIFLVIICVFFFYTLPTLWLTIRSIRMRHKLDKSFRRRWAGVSLGLFVVGVALCFLAEPLQDRRFSLKDDIYPANAIYNLLFAINKAEKNSKYKTTSAKFSFHAVKPVQAEGKREIYLLVVGETSRAMEWSLYGYERKTTPRLEQLEGLAHFTDVVTQSNNTHKSVPIILSSASAENYGVIYKEKSIVTAFKEAGFHTVVIANQKLTTSMIGAFYKEADTFIDMSSMKTSYLSSLHDAAVLPYLQKELDQTTGNLFVVLHTYGSHFNYHERYPKEFATFTPDKAEGIRASYKDKLRNAYDNSILYTDYLLSEIVNQLSNTDACASMLYLSDHGEDIFDDSRERYLHASPIPTYYQLHIPYVLWFSEAYRSTYPDKYSVAVSHQSQPVSTNSVFHTMLDMAGVKTFKADSTLALTNSAFTVRDRMYLDDHDEPIPFWKVGLKKQDLMMLDKWKMVYAKE